MKDEPQPILHHIRLRGPWTTSTDGPLTLHRRSFGWPAALDPGERVWLVGAAVPGGATVVVNGTTVGTATASGPFAADITPLLKARNELVIAAATGEPLGDVGLDVRTA